MATAVPGAFARGSQGFPWVRVAGGRHMAGTGQPGADVAHDHGMLVDSKAHAHDEGVHGGRRGRGGEGGASAGDRRDLSRRRCRARPGAHRAWGARARAHRRGGPGRRVDLATSRVGRLRRAALDRAGPRQPQRHPRRRRARGPRAGGARGAGANTRAAVGARPRLARRGPEGLRGWRRGVARDHRRRARGGAPACRRGERQRQGARGRTVSRRRLRRRGPAGLGELRDDPAGPGRARALRRAARGLLGGGPRHGGLRPGGRGWDPLSRRGGRARRARAGEAPARS